MSPAAGYLFPLWQLLNQCRYECDQRLWCTSFELNSISKTCALSDVAADVASNATVDSAGTLLVVKMPTTDGTDLVSPGFAPASLAEMPPEMTRP
jgi:hypothetical protein